jgi:secreted trypsin-like serine protease
MGRLASVVVTALLAVSLVGAASVPASAALSAPGNTGTAVAAAPGNTVTPDIVGGSDSDTLFSASLQIPRAGEGLHHFCSGVRITDQWVATAAHCLSQVIPGTTQVRVNSTARNSGGQLVGVTKAIANPDYTGLFEGDIALVKLDRRVPGFVLPMGVGAGPVGTVTKAYGWGYLCDDLTNPTCTVAAPVLQELAVKRTPGRECEMIDPDTGLQLYNDTKMFCVVAANGALAGPCFGDSGGAVVRAVTFTTPHGGRETIHFLVGVIVGDGDDLTRRNHLCTTSPTGGQGHAIMTDVGAYLWWIFGVLTAEDPGAARQLQASHQQYAQTG